MNANFEQTITRFLLQHGKDVLNDYQCCKSLLKDFTKNEYQKETRLFMQAVEIGCYRKIVETDEPETTARILIGQLQEENFILEEAAYFIIELLFLVLKNYRLRNTKPVKNTQHDQKSSKGQSMKRPITSEMTKQSYIHAKLVYNGTLSIDNAAEFLEKDYGMNPASAKMYITNFKYFVEGKKYTRIMKLEDTEYYLGKIYQDLGKSGLQNALKALMLHIDYLEQKRIGSPAPLRALHTRLLRQIT
jgi:hypothetical protein